MARNICCCAFILVLILVTAFNLYLQRSLEQSFVDNEWKFPVLFSQLLSDSTGNYRIWTLPRDSKVSQDAHRASRKVSADLTIVTQTSVWNLPDLTELVDSWNGKVSVGVFAPGSDLEYALDLIAKLKVCSEKIKKLVTFHLVMVSSHPPVHDNLLIYLKRAKSHPQACSTVVVQNDKRADNYANEGIPYPVNVLRNVALNSAETSHVLVIDVDMIPSPNLLVDFKRHFSSFIMPNGVYVLPTFELKSKQEIPKSKDQLLKYWTDGTARPFYEKVCWKCQKYTEYERWRRSSVTKLSVAYKVDWQDPWEPFFIAEKTAVHYDERFKQYGFNRISQVCETHFSGHNFYVLENAFLIHRGFKETTKFHKSKDTENAINRIIFRTFKKELKEEYPESTRHC